MSLYDYQYSQQISAGDPPFYGLIMAAMRKADTTNIVRLRVVFPEVYDVALLQDAAVTLLTEGS